MKYSDPGDEPEFLASCNMTSPCIFRPGGVPGHLFTVKVYAHRDSILGIPATTNHNIGMSWSKACSSYLLMLYL